MDKALTRAILDRIENRMRDYPGTVENSKAMRVFEESEHAVFYPAGRTASEVVDNLFSAFNPGNYFMSCVTLVSKSPGSNFFEVHVRVIRK